MKTYKHLYEEIISDANIELAIKESCKRPKKNKKKSKQLAKLRQSPNRVKIVRNWIEQYEGRRIKPLEIFDGISRKKRKIYVPSVKETVVQHAVVQVLDKYLTKGMYEHTYAAIKGRGQCLAKKRMKSWILHNRKDCKYYLKLDIKQYFPSVPQKILMQKLSKQIKDDKTLNLIKEILKASKDGIPLGFYISQWFANYYLMEFDHILKEKIGCKLYMRWMDDMVIFCSSKRKLWKQKAQIEKELKKLGLRLKENWRLSRFHYFYKGKEGGEFLDYMGFRFYRNRITLRRSIYYKMCRKARRLAKKEKVTAYEAKQFMSYIGWLKMTDTYDAYREYIKPILCIQNLKRKISRYDRSHQKGALSWSLTM